MAMKKKTMKAFLLLGMALVVGILFWFGNSVIEVTHIPVSIKELPEGFQGYRIVQISDLHGKAYGAKEKKLAKLIEKEKPDLIVITGDVVDKRNYNDQPIIDLVEQLAGVAPIYFVTGNHEWWTGNSDILKTKLRRASVYVLENSFIDIQRKGGIIRLYGMEDPAAIGLNGGDTPEIRGILESMRKDAVEEEATAGIKIPGILLAHRPELISIYAEMGYDLALSGHAHGGQVRLPIIGPIVAPNQGYFPKYTAGLYHEKEAQLVVSRGLGNSIVPIRILNRPNLVVVTLEKN